MRPSGHSACTMWPVVPYRRDTLNLGGQIILVCLDMKFWKQNMILILLFSKINHILFNFFKNKLYFIQFFLNKSYFIQLFFLSKKSNLEISK
jgi:hypothetical protein